MSIGVHSGLCGTRRVVSAGAMYDAVLAEGIIPFFAGPVPGFSIEEMVPREHWFTDEDLGPWDWKIDLVQSGEIAYGKFLYGGKAAFATAAVYRELMNYRRAQKKYRPAGKRQLAVMKFLREKGGATVKDLRLLLGENKAAVDSLLQRLQMDTLVVTGDIERVYRGPDLHYSGWQKSTFCMPEALFDCSPDGSDDSPESVFFGISSARRAAPAQVRRSPAESYAFLADTIRSHHPSVTAADLAKILG